MGTVQRLQETKRATADRTRHERERRERRLVEKEAIKLNAQCAPPPFTSCMHSNAHYPFE